MLQQTRRLYQPLQPCIFESYPLKNVTSERTLWLSSGLIYYLLKYHPAVCSEDKEEPSDYHAVQFEADICLTLSLSARSGWRRAAERSCSWARLLAPDPAAAAGFVCRGSKRNALKGSERPCQTFPVLFQYRKGAFSLRSVQSKFSTLILEKIVLMRSYYCFFIFNCRGK